MASRDFYHDAARTALENDGWLITDDPLDLTIGEVALFADLGAVQRYGIELIIFDPGKKTVVRWIK